MRQWHSGMRTAAIRLDRPRGRDARTLRHAVPEPTCGPRRTVPRASKAEVAQDDLLEPREAAPRPSRPTSWLSQRTNIRPHTPATTRLVPCKVDRHRAITGATDGVSSGAGCRADSPAKARARQSSCMAATPSRRAGARNSAGRRRIGPIWLARGGPRSPPVEEEKRRAKRADWSTRAGSASHRAASAESADGTAGPAVNHLPPFCSCSASSRP